jgi:hypothetical protein
MDIGFGTWNIRSLYMTRSLKMVARELQKHKLDSVGAQKVRWRRVAQNGQRIIHSSMEKGMKIII